LTSTSTISTQVCVVVCRRPVCQGPSRRRPFLTWARSRQRHSPPGGADDGPLAVYLLEAAQQELAETARLFDLPEHRLRELLAQPVAARVYACGRPRYLTKGGSHKLPEGDH
jgi:hypothetical protein